VKTAEFGAKSNPEESIFLELRKNDKIEFAQCKKIKTIYSSAIT